MGVNMRSKPMALIIETDQETAKVIFDTLCAEADIVPIYSSALKTAKSYLRKYPEISRVVVTYDLFDDAEQVIEQSLQHYVSGLGRDIQIISVLSMDRQDVVMTKTKVLLLK